MKLPIEKSESERKRDITAGEILLTLREMVAVDKEAGCEKLPEGPMRDNCEKKKEEGEENDKKEKKAADRTWADFNTALAKLMKGLKRDVGATKIKQNGSPSAAGHRNIWVKLPNRGNVDVWVEDGQTQLFKLLRGGQSGWGPVIPYGNQTPEQVYKKMVAGLKEIDKKAAGKSAATRDPANVEGWLRWED